MHSESRSAVAEWLTSPRLRMPTIRLLLLITGNLRIFSSSMCRTALARSSSSRQQWISSVITSRAVAPRASKLSSANPLHTMSRSVSPIGMAPTSWSRINFASSVTGVSGPTQSTPLCIASLTFMADLRRSSSSSLDGMQLRSLYPPTEYTRTRVRKNRLCHGVVDMANGQVVLVTTEGLSGGSPMRTVYYVAEEDPTKAQAIIAEIMAPNEKVEAYGLLPEAAVKALGLKPGEFRSV